VTGKQVLQVRPEYRDFVDLLERGYLKFGGAPRGDRVASALERIEARLAKLESPKRRRAGARR